MGSNSKELANLLEQFFRYFESWRAADMSDFTLATFYSNAIEPNKSKIIAELEKEGESK